MASFLISEDKRPIPFRIRANEMRMGTLRLLASAGEKGTAVLIQVVGTEETLSFGVSKERILLAGEVFDRLACSPCHRMENGVRHPDPVTSERVKEVLEAVEKTSQSGYEKPSDDVRQIILHIISEKSFSVGKDPDLGFEKRLMEAVEKSLRAAIS